MLCCFGKSTHIVWRAAFFRRKLFYGTSYYASNDGHIRRGIRARLTHVGASFAACRQPGEKIEFPEILHINKMALCAYVCRLIWLAFGMCDYISIKLILFSASWHVPPFLPPLCAAHRTASHCQVSHAASIHQPENHRVPHEKVK